MPILPDYLAQLNNEISALHVPKSVMYKTFDLHYVPTILGKHPLAGSSLINFTISNGKEKLLEDYILENSMDEQTKDNLEEENGSIGMLLAAKALVQLIVTPLVGNLTLRVGYRIPVVFGTFCLFVASIGISKIFKIIKKNFSYTLTWFDSVR